MLYKQADHFVTAWVALLLDARKRKGWSHDTLAEKAGVHRSTISLIETGKRIPSIHICYRLCCALDISFAKLAQQAERTIK